MMTQEFLIEEFIGGLSFMFGCTLGCLLGIGFLIFILNVAYWLKGKIHEFS